MDFIKIKRMKKIVSNDGTKLACVGVDICEEGKLKSIIVDISNKHNFLFDDNDINYIASYVIKKNNHKIINLKELSYSIIEANNVLNHTNKKNVSILSR